MSSLYTSAEKTQQESPKVGAGNVTGAPVEQSSTVLIHAGTCCPTSTLIQPLSTPYLSTSSHTYGHDSFAQPQTQWYASSIQDDSLHFGSSAPAREFAPGTLSVHKLLPSEAPSGTRRSQWKTIREVLLQLHLLRSDATCQRHWSFPSHRRPFHPPSNTTSSKSSCSQPRRTSRKARYVNDSNSSGHPSA